MSCCCFNPETLTAGGYSGYGSVCYRGGGWRAFAQPTAFSVPGNGRAGVPLSYTAAEVPFVPQQLVGIPPGAVTGPQPLVYLAGLNYGMATDIVAASLTGPYGAVPVQVVDEQTPGGQGSFVHSGVMIPPRPLEPYARYQVQLSWLTGDGRRYEQRFGFETDGKRNGVRFDVIRYERDSYQVEFQVFSAASQPKFVLSGPGGRSVSPRLLRQPWGYFVRPHALAPGRWRACVSSGGRETGFQPARECASFTMPPLLRLGARSGRRATLSVAPVALGRAAALRLTPVRRSCRRGAACAWVRAGKTRALRLRLRARRLRIVLPAASRGRAVRVSVRLAGFKRAGTSYSASASERIYR